METLARSGSKRKHDVNDEAPSVDGLLSLPADDEDRTPKRSRSSARHSDAGTSDDGRVRSVRRRKGVRNLSNLNLRHAAEQQRLSDTPRASKFQEGSLTDKPSAQPPSLFTRLVRPHSVAATRIDDLMQEYHDSETSSTDNSRDDRSRPVSIISETAAPREEPKSIFRFGRSLSKFYPFGLWNRLYDETHEKLLQQNRLEAERKAMLKAEAEARYAEMKQAGHFRGVSALAPGRAVETPTPRDSVMAPGSDCSSIGHMRDISMSSGKTPLHEDVVDQENVGPVNTERKKLRGVASRFSLARPSLSNLKNGLKRVASNLDLSQFGARDGTSTSPEKVDRHQHENRTLHSRQESSHGDVIRLTRRVSDLERKLEKAREELGHAIEEASPAPRACGKFHRFTPSTSRRTKFVPGGLPTLPSERLLFPEGYNPGEDAHVNVTSYTQMTNIALDEDDRSETIRASRARTLPPRASTIFDPLPDHPKLIIKGRATADSSHERTEITYDANGMPLPFVQLTDYISEQITAAALDSSPKVARSLSMTPKKRKTDVDLDYRPDEEDDDDAEWAQATPNKRLKSSEKSHGDLRGKARETAAKKKSPNARRAQRPRTAPRSDSPVQSSDAHQTNQKHVAFEAAVVQSAPASDALESAHDGEATTLVPLKGVPYKPTAKATPARFESLAGRPGSLSPSDHLETARESIHSVLQAGEAARHRRERERERPASPTTSLTGRTIDQIVEERSTPTSGEDAVPSVPGSSSGGDPVKVDAPKAAAKPSRSRSRSKPVPEDFQWPEDVF